MGAIRNPEAGLMEALRTLRAVPGVIAPVRLSLILLACGGTRYTSVNEAESGPLIQNTVPPVFCMSYYCYRFISYGRGLSQ